MYKLEEKTKKNLFGNKKLENHYQIQARENTDILKIIRNIFKIK